MRYGSLAFNDCSLFIYLDNAYKSFIRGESTPKKFTIIAICSTHAIKFISDRISSFYSKTEKRTVLLNFAKAIDCKTHDSFVEIISNLYLVLKSENISYNFLREFTHNAGVAANLVESIDDSVEKNEI